MKSVKTAYWIFTILLIVMMLLSGISSFFPNQKAIDMMHHIGYPFNLLHFLAVAKILGVIAILVPGFPRLKEWAYAGFTFDLIGAFFAGISTGDPVSLWIPVLIGLVLVFGSYYFHHRRKGPAVY